MSTTPYVNDVVCFHSSIPKCVYEVARGCDASSEVGGDPVVQVQPSALTAADYAWHFSYYTVSQNIVRLYLSIPLNNYLVSILVTAIVRWSNHGG